ncbi:Uncharacterised protein [Raoultella ornithinolytica]|nr:Uncharacterised protein [Raoultella ornithinolytica]
MRLVVQSNVLKPFKKESVGIIRRWNKKENENDVSFFPIKM